MESELQGLKSQNAAGTKGLENEVESLRNADPETSSSKSELDALKTFVAYGKLYDDDSLRYVNATKDGKALNAVLDWESNGDEVMLVLDKQGLFVEATINVAKEPNSWNALYEGDGDVYETEYKGITFQTFNHLCLKSAGVPSYLHHIEMGAPSWGAGKFVLSEFIYFEGVGDATVLGYFIDAKPNTRIIHSIY